MHNPGMAKKRVLFVHDESRKARNWETQFCAARGLYILYVLLTHHCTKLPPPSDDQRDTETTTVVFAVGHCSVLIVVWPVADFNCWCIL